MYLDSLDIANRAIEHCGLEPILSVTEDSNRNRHTAFAYDKLRRAELRRNVWRFAIRNVVLRPVDTTTMVVQPVAWNNATTYLPGAIVSDTNGQLWISGESENVNNTPGDTAVWDMYFGPLSVSLWSATDTYFAGELVYKSNGIPGGYGIFLSLQNGNAAIPDVGTAYDPAATYYRGNVVTYGGFNWRSLIEFSIGVTPAVGPLAFDPAATYTTAQTVTGSDNYIYSSVGNGNIGHDPTTDAGVHWTNTAALNGWSKAPAVTTSALSWRPVPALLKNLSFTYPIGSGPSSQAFTRNIFRLPAGYLKPAPQDPKAGSTSFLGAPSGLTYNDWRFQGNYIISQDAGPMVFRFVADVTDVQTFDDMFCEGLACSIATAVCEPLTQSQAKLATIASEYKLRMGEARTVNAIETGADEPPEDDYITCRN